MIPRTADWKNALATAVRDPAELLALLKLPSALLAPARRAAARFPLRVPRSFVARMRTGDPADPLLRQVLPLDAELQPAPGFVTDPLGERNAAVAPGVLHKYAGRVLFTVTGACAVHCRYCFRRHFPYGEENPRQNGWLQAMDYLSASNDIDEVILSGGDPLAMDDDVLGELAGRIAAIPHIRRLRIHSRLPVVLPERVTPALIDWLTNGRLAPVLVIHANHPAELDAQVANSLACLGRAGVTLLNQTVLLRGVNDGVAVLSELSEKLFEMGVLPYYLHLLDPVAGAAHFDVAPEDAAGLIDGLRRRLPGYLMPRPVREIADEGFKRPAG